MRYDQGGLLSESKDGLTFENQFMQLTRINGIKGENQMLLSVDTEKKFLDRIKFPIVIKPSANEG